MYSLPGTGRKGRSLDHVAELVQNQRSWGEYGGNRGKVFLGSRGYNGLSDQKRMSKSKRKEQPVN